MSAIWNQAGWVGNEDFIEIRPKRGDRLLPLLAVLNSDFGKVAIRSQAQQYGGGVYNLLPSDVPELLVPYAELQPSSQLYRLAPPMKDYTAFASRRELTRSVGDILQLDVGLVERLVRGTHEQRDLASHSDRVGTTDSERGIPSRRTRSARRS